MEIAGKMITIYESEKGGAPLVLFHVVNDEGQEVYQEIKKRTEKDFTFVSVGKINWDAEMSPWEAPPVMKGDAFSGGADGYLETLEQQILPEIFRKISGNPEYMVLAGYSLAGLFSVYAAYKTELFSRLVSASGSFWYPDFLKFVKEHEMKRQPEKIYFSLGDKEAKTRNPVLKTVEENTRWLKEHYQKMGIETIFESNPGNHFQDVSGRMAKGIAWVLE
ncbi:MAG: alpha/beta hydrolase [Lachnospiraceae bacterium]|nr:alpha/beta hydrolase [Lachnospiraceae bacterium]